MFFADAWVIWIQIVFKIHIYQKMCQSAIFKAKVKGEGHLNFKVKLTIILLKVYTLNLVIILRSDSVFDKIQLICPARRPYKTISFITLQNNTYKEHRALIPRESYK